MSEKKSVKEVNDKELEDVSGGAFWFSSNKYKSKDFPEFKVGDRVKVREVNFFSPGTMKVGYIIEVLSKTSVVNFEYRYKVQYLDGSTESDVFESQMMCETSKGYEKAIDPNKKGTDDLI